MSFSKLASNSTTLKFSKKCFLTTSLSLISLALSAPLQANQSNTDADSTSSQTALEEELDWLKAESYVETATKTKEHIKKSGASVSVITDRQLEQSGAQNLMDALRLLPGFNVQGSFIGIPSISVRGAKTDSNEKILFLVNGHSINNNLVNGGASWTYSDFRIDDIKRIEVVRGPGSALYGTSALVAVINLVTKTANDIKQNNISIAAGSDATKRANLQIADKLDRLKYAINLNISSTDGTEEYVRAQGDYTKDNENRMTVGFNAQYDSFNFQGKYIEREAGPFVGIANLLNQESQQDYTEYWLELSHNSRPNQDWSIDSKIHYDFFRADNYWEIVPGALLGSPTVKNEKFGGELQLSFNSIPNHKILTGISFEHHTQFDVKHYTNFDPTTGTPSPPYRDVSDIWNWNSNHDRDIAAAFIQDIWDITDQIRLITGARHDHYSDFGGSFNPRASLSYQFHPSFLLTGIYGQAFRAPNFGELYNVNNPAIQGDPNLKPEEIETFEFSLDSELNRRTNLKTTYFHNNIKNIIDHVGAGYRNSDRLITSGVELELNSRLENGSKFGANYTYQYPRNMSQKVRADGIPMHSAHVSFTYRHSRYLNAYVAANYRGKMNVNNAVIEDIKDVTTVDLSVNWKPKASPLKFVASIKNLFDRKTADYSAAIPTGLPGEGMRLLLKTTLDL